MAAAGLHLTKECAICAQAYRQSRVDQMYCSRKCGQTAWRGRSYNYTFLECGICHKAFKRIHSKQKYCSENCASDAQRISKLRLGGPGKQWSAGKEFVARTKCEVCANMFYCPPSQKRRGGGKYCSVTCRSAVMSRDPSTFPQVVTKRGRGGKRADLDDKFFRSRWEANYARYLNWLVGKGEIDKWEFEVDTYEFPVKKGSKYYTPDFKVFENDGSFKYHEVKGYMDQKSATKLKRMAKYFPQHPVVLIEQKQYAEIKKKIGPMLPFWE